jgi:bifunctional UDP-N-acetylglucosamine pyrophosphorylase / glucosamine-1-phosphate N-acetyltransferase
MNDVTAIILAAGEGKRMRSRRPKVLHPLCGRPLIGYALRVARTVADRLVMVVSPNADDVLDVAGDGVVAVEQRERLGTGHAVREARQACGDAPTILVLPSDMPLLTTETFERLVSHHAATGAAVTLVTANVAEPQGYGRVLRQRGRVTHVVEDRDATDDQKRITEINTAVYCFDARRFWPALAEVRPNNDQGEYYLTDVIGIMARAGGRIEAITVQDPAEALGVNDRRQLATVAAIQRRRILDRLMESGVTIIDPATTYIEDGVAIGPDTIIYPQVVIEGASAVGSECVISSGCQIRSCRIGDRVLLKPYCVLTDSTIEDDAQLGPFCHLRPQAVIGTRAHVGNFIEVKNSRIGRGSKAPHVSYIGDATVGEGVNVGAGTIICNYDGVAKHRTRIGDRVFVGSNSTLVAPLTVGDGAYVAAGSTITRDVPAGALALGRAQQVDKPGWTERRARERAAKTKDRTPGKD